MTVYTITSSTSVFTGGVAFNSDSAGPDRLFVDAGAFLIGDTAALLNTGTGPWSVTVNGTVIGTGTIGILLNAGSESTSKIRIAANGEVRGALDGIQSNNSATINNAGIVTGDENGIRWFAGDAHKLFNKSTITGGTYAIFDAFGSSNDTIINTGTLSGAVHLADGMNRLTNKGTIDAPVLGGSDTDTVTNGGTIGGYVFLGDGSNKLTNSGTITRQVYGGNDADTIRNTGIIGSSVDLGQGNNELTNGGTIYEVVGGNGADMVINSHVIESFVGLGHGENQFTNSGTVGSSYTGGFSADTVGNTGTILGNVFLSEGTNTLTNSGTIGGFVRGGAHTDTVKNSGSIGGFVDLLDGNDTYSGGKFADVVLDGNGTDAIKLGGGNDTYIATGSSGSDGFDIVAGGPGIDTYDASAASNDLTINLDSRAHAEPLGGGVFFGRSSAANTAQDSSGTPSIGTDKITGFENAKAGNGDDVLFGSSGSNTLEGNGGADDLWGFGGNDTLDGGTGEDKLLGGAGRDILIGGSDGDVFWYLDISESGVTSATRDLIMDFAADGFGGDLIRLWEIDADTTVAGNQDFTFIGTNVLFSNTPGELRAYFSAIGQIIEGDVNGDGEADFSIEIYDPTHAISLSGNQLHDFLL